LHEAVEKKILRLIATDFFCWIPLCIMVFINFHGVEVGSIAYAVAAIVLLPINSALNPLLYSNIIDNIISKIKSQKQRASGSTSSMSNRRTLQQSL